MAKISVGGIFTVPLTKLDDQIEFNGEGLTEDTVYNIFMHGLKQLVNDAASGEKDPVKIREKCEKAARRVERNEWKPGSRGRAADPLTKMMETIMVQSLVDDHGLAKGKALKLVEERGLDGLCDGEESFAALRDRAQAALDAQKPSGVKVKL